MEGRGTSVVIEPKTKVAIGNIGKLHTESHHQGVDGYGIAACIVVDAYVQAEARARMATARLIHSRCNGYQMVELNPDSTWIKWSCAHPEEFHGRTLADWVAEVKAELEK